MREETLLFIKMNLLYFRIFLGRHALAHRLKAAPRFHSDFKTMLPPARHRRLFLILSEKFWAYGFHFLLHFTSSRHNVVLGAACESCLPADIKACRFALAF